MEARGDPQTQMNKKKFKKGDLVTTTCWAVAGRTGQVGMVVGNHPPFDTCWKVLFPTGIVVIQQDGLKIHDLK